MTKSQIIQEAMRLSDDDRREVADALVSALEADDEPAPSPEFLAELERRSRELERDPSQAIPAEEVFRRLRSRLSPRP